MASLTDTIKEYIGNISLPPTPPNPFSSATSSFGGTTLLNIAPKPVEPKPVLQQPEGWTYDQKLNMYVKNDVRNNWTYNRLQQSPRLMDRSKVGGDFMNIDHYNQYVNQYNQEFNKVNADPNRGFNAEINTKIARQAGLINADQSAGGGSVAAALKNATPEQIASYTSLRRQYQPNYNVGGSSSSAASNKLGNDGFAGFDPDAGAGGGKKGKNYIPQEMDDGIRRAMFRERRRLQRKAASNKTLINGATGSLGTASTGVKSLLGA